MAGYGQLFPQPVDPGDFFLVTLENQTGTAREIIRVEGRSGDTFTNIVRAQEGTTAQAWASSSGNDTLVDHRVTAETMRQALLQPVAGPGGSTDIIVKKDGATVTSTGQTLDFTGAGVTVTDVLGVPTINIPGTGGGSGNIPGENPPPVQIDPGWTLAGSSSTYSDTNRGFKFFVTITRPANHTSQTFEVLGNISGNIAANAETVSFNRSARVGFNHAGSVNVTLDTGTKTIELVWTNNELSPVIIQCVRIQMTP